MVSTATRIAKNVVPQTTATAQWQKEFIIFQFVMQCNRQRYFFRSNLMGTVNDVLCLNLILLLYSDLLILYL
jgi:hypothetical protein